MSEKDKEVLARIKKSKSYLSSPLFALLTTTDRVGTGDANQGLQGKSHSRIAQGASAAKLRRQKA